MHKSLAIGRSLATILHQMITPELLVSECGAIKNEVPVKHEQLDRDQTQPSKPTAAPAVTAPPLALMDAGRFQTNHFEQ